MSRINVYNGEVLAGWFDPDAAVRYAPRDRKTWGALYHTRSGKWVLLDDPRDPFLPFDRPGYLTVEQAAIWLLDHGYAAGLVEEACGPPQGTGPGRPEIGPSIQFRLEPGTVAELDRIAAAGGTTRAQLIREAIHLLLEHLRGELVTPEEEGT